MDAATLQDSQSVRLDASLSGLAGGRLIGAAQFRNLLVSHRRMVRADRRQEQLRGLQDLDTGEIFLTDERRLLEARRQ
jgi:hypothetical protein